MSRYEFHTKIGSSTNIGTDCKILSNAEVVHPGDINPAGVRCRIASTSTDDYSGGTGIQKVRLEYFDNTWTLNEEIVTMPTAPDTYIDTIADNIYRIESFEAFKVGSGNVAAGTITLKSTDDVNLFAQIDIGRRIFERCLHYAEIGSICVPLSAVLSSSSSGGVVFCISATQDNTPDGGNHILKPYISVEVKQSTTQIGLDEIINMDMTDNTYSLGIGITARGLLAGQTGTATLICRDFHID